MYLILLEIFIVIFFISSCSSSPKSSKGTFNSFYSKENIPNNVKLPENLNEINAYYMQNKADYHFTLGESYSFEENHEKAISEFRQALIYDPESYHLRLRLAAEYVKQGLLNQAISEAQEIKKKNPKLIEVRLFLGSLYSILNLFKKAEEEFYKIIEIAPNNTDARMYLAALLAEQKKYNEALKYFDSLFAIDEFQNAYLVYYYKAKINLEQKNKNYIDLAIKNLEKCINLNLNFTEGVILLGDLYQQKKSTSKALELYKNYQNEFGAEENIAEELAQIYISKQRYDEALSQLEFVEKKSPDDVEVKFKVCQLLMLKKEYSLATVKLEEILEKVPESDKVRFYLAALYEEVKNNKKAIYHFLQISPLSHYYPEATIHASFLQKENNLEAAKNTILNALEYRKDIPEFYVMHASILDEKSKPKEAVEILNKAIEKFPQNTKIRFLLSSIYDSLKNIDEAILQLKEILQIEKDHLQALNYLAYIYAENNIYLNEAEKLINRALAKKPNDGYFLDTLGWIYFKQGKIEQSIKTLETALSLVQEESIIAEHLGDVYYQYQLNAKAKSMYLKAYQMENDQNKKDYLKQKIVNADKMPSSRFPASSSTILSN